MFEVAPSMVGVAAPDFRGGGPWVNTRPLSITDLRGKVVIVTFFTYTCVNCLRTLPFFRRWQQRYADAGLIIIGVHTPEFDFEQQPENVISFIRRRGLTYPVVLDNEKQIWHAYANHYWPHRYVVDARGVIRYDHAGEGAYGETEAILRALLNEAKPGVVLPSEAVPAQELIRGVCLPATTELYCGYFRGVLGNEQDYAEESVARYRDHSFYENGRIYLHGTWEAHAEYVRHARRTERPVDYVGFQYQAFEVNAILRQTEGVPVRVVVTRDNQPVPRDAAGHDIRYDGAMSFVEVVEPRLYNLISDPHFGAHRLHLACASDQLAVYAFSFGGCASDVGEEL